MAWPALAVLLLDQISKSAILQSLRTYETVPVITGFFNVVHVRNRGMAFGLMSRPDMGLIHYFLVAATLGAIVVLLFWALKPKPSDDRITIGLSLIFGGAVGNLADRIRFQEVIDFLDFYIGSYHWPAFNVADVAITIGTFWVASSLFFQRPPKN
jgi:signal peptidase II